MSVTVLGMGLDRAVTDLGLTSCFGVSMLICDVGESRIYDALGMQSTLELLLRNFQSM